MRSTDFKQKALYANQLLKRAVYIAWTIKNLGRLTGIARSTLTKIARGDHKGTTATRMRLETFIEQNQNRVGRPFQNKEAA